MYAVKYTTENGEGTEYFQSWYDVLKEGLLVGFWFTIMGLVILACTPFWVIWTAWRPQCTGFEVKKRELFKEVVVKEREEK